MIKKKVVNLIIFSVSLFLLNGCYKVNEKIKPSINYKVRAKYLKSLPSAFDPITENEKEKPWGQELFIASSFADELDLYRAVSTYKRAEFLIPKSYASKKLEMQYDTLLCYYLGKRYHSVIDSFERSNLSRTDRSFKPFRDLLILVYQSYLEINQNEKAYKLLQVLKDNYPNVSEKLSISTALAKADMDTIKLYASPKRKYLASMLNCYEKEKKSIGGAGFLNGICPGLGYLYLGQKKSALTAFLINGLFITAAVEFFLHQHVAAGIITASFEMGWYIGGIYGAAEEAKFFNERLYEKKASNIMNREKLFPILMLEYKF